MASYSRRQRHLRPPGATDLDGHEGIVRRIVPMPDGLRVATACDDNNVRVYSVDTGDLLDTLRGHTHAVSGLSALGGDILLSIGLQATLRVWDVSRRECLFTANVKGVATAVLGPAIFFVGDGRDLLFFSHDNGENVEEIWRESNAHAPMKTSFGSVIADGGLINDISVSGERFATASDDKTAAVWCWGDDNRPSKLTSLALHKAGISSVAMNSKFIVTGSKDCSVRVHSAETFECIRIIGDMHANVVSSLCLVGQDVIVSTSLDATSCVVELPTVASCVKLPFLGRSAAVLNDGRIGVVGDEGGAFLFSPPGEVAAAFRQHSAKSSSELAGLDADQDTRAEVGLPPVQKALVDVALGTVQIETACRETVTAAACGASVPEFCAAHSLIALAVADGYVAGSTKFGSSLDHWYRHLYSSARNLQMSVYEFKAIQLCLKEAETIGVLKNSESVLAGIFAREDLVQEVDAIRQAGGNMCWAITRLDARVTERDKTVEKLAISYQRLKRNAQVSTALGVLLLLVPFVGGSIASIAGGAGQFMDGAEWSALAASLLGAGFAVRSQPGNSSILSRVREAGKALLSKSAMDKIPEEDSRNLTGALASVDIGLDELRTVFENLGGPRGRDAEVSIDVVEVGDGLAEHGAERPLMQIEDVGKDKHRHKTVPVEPMPDLPSPVEPPSDLPSPVEPPSDLPSPVEPPADLPSPVAPPSDRDPADASSDTAASSNSRETLDDCIALKIRELEALGVNSKSIETMAREKLASALAAHMIGYEVDKRSRTRYEEIARCLEETFYNQDIRGELLVGNNAITEEEFVTVVMTGLEDDEVCKATLGNKASLHRFMARLADSQKHKGKGPWPLGLGR